MAQADYPPDSVRNLLSTDLVTSPTREALQPRLLAHTQNEQSLPSFFEIKAFETLTAVVARLFNLDPAFSHILATQLDRQLTEGEGRGDGWRYDLLPSDQETHRQGLIGLDESANLLFRANFISLDEGRQAEVLKKVQTGDAPGAVWHNLDPRRYFEELLARLTECYYADPLALERIGYVGMADRYGWQKLGLNQLENWEPRRGATFLPQIKVTRPPAEVRQAKMPPMRRYELDKEVDAVIIGTGAGGAPLLARLAQAGLKVVALEAGQFWQPDQDFATDEPSQAKLFWTDERLSAGVDPIAFGSNNSGIGVGGSTLHYTAYVPRAQPDDFQLYRDFGVGVDWPIGYADLEPYYEELEQFLGVSGPAHYPWGAARRQPYPLAPLPLNGPAQLMERGCATLGLRTSPAANAALSARYYQPGVGWRPACTNRGFCQAGCSVGAKASMDVTFIPVALAAGAELRPESFVTGFECDRNGYLSGVIYQQDGREERQRCRTVFLCAGAMETPRLLLINNLANSSGQVGRNFMAHTGLQIWGQFDEDIRPYKGIPGGLISEDTHRPAGVDFAGGYLLQSIGVLPVTYASQLARGAGLWGDELHQHMQGYNNTAGINILGECLPILVREKTNTA